MDISPFQKQHIHIYQNFINNNDKVISLPIINRRSSYLEQSQNGLHIFSSSKLRMYISFTETSIAQLQHPGYITYFNKKVGRNKRKQNIISHPKIKIDFLIETDKEIIDYRNEIAEYLETLINRTTGTEKKQTRKNNSTISSLLQEESLGLSIIHKTKTKQVHHKLENILKKKDNMRKQLLFSHQHNKKKQENISNYTTEYIAKLNISNEYKNKEMRMEKEKKAIQDYIGQKILAGCIKSLQGEDLNKIFQDFNKQQLLNTQIIHFNSQIEHRVIQHNKYCFSVLIPWYISKAAEDEFIKHISQKQKATHLITQQNIFQNQQIIRIEHDPKNNIYSPRHCDKTYFTQDKNGKINFGKNTQKQNTITLNTIENKIYIGGKKLESKEIHSQTMTIELLSKLLQQPNQLIHNKDLKPSSYSKNKNDMNSKIILPLKKIVQKKLGKPLQISCMGQLHNFFIELNTEDINISTIKTN